MGKTSRPPPGKQELVTPSYDPTSLSAGRPKFRIFDSSPCTWQELQSFVAKVFAEIGCRVKIGTTVDIPRGKVNVDVMVRDEMTAPHSLYVCECKFWNRKVSKGEIHAFRTVVGESGANRGFIISRAGFQSGAVEAAEFTNLDLVTWIQFESIMLNRWIAAITRTLHPQFEKAFAHMEHGDNSMWAQYEFSDAGYNEWNQIIQRYLLINNWHLFHVMSSAGIRPMPEFRKPIPESIAGRSGMYFDSLRKIVDYGPSYCQSAISEFEAFWARQRRIPGAKLKKPIFKVYYRNE